MREMKPKMNQSDERLSAGLRELAAASGQGASAEAGLMLKEVFRRHHARRKRALRVRAAIICICVAGLAASFLLRRPSPAINSGDVEAVRTIPPERISYPEGIIAAETATRRSVSPQRIFAHQNALSATGGFVALPAGAMVPPGDELRVVRLEMRGEDLRLVGAPVSEEIATRRITADFVVGHDGTPYAMRLVGSNF